MKMLKVELCYEIVEGEVMFFYSYKGFTTTLINQEIEETYLHKNNLSWDVLIMHLWE